MLEQLKVEQGTKSEILLRRAAGYLERVQAGECVELRGAQPASGTEPDRNVLVEREWSARCPSQLSALHLHFLSFR